MIDFIKFYWREILEVVCIVASIVICCIKKKPVKVVDTLKEVVLRVLPYCIEKAESSPKGEKLQVCISILEAAMKELGYELTPELTSFAIQQVELILCTPQKKGVKDEK